MTESEPTTDRARRQRAVESGATDTAVDRVSGRSNPGGQPPRGTPRSRQRDAQRDVAAEIGIERSGVATVDRIGGMDVFLRSGGADQFADVVQRDFASAADFVEPDDVTAQVDRQAITADPMVARDRRDDVAARARQQTAADTEFIRASDLEADVGAMGVTGLGVAADRRDDVANRTRTTLADRSPFTEPDDFAVTVTDRGVDEAMLTPAGERRAAARQFESDTALGDVNPDTDLTDTGDGFGLTTDAQRELGALRLDEQVPEVTITPDDVTLEDGQAVFEREVTR
jgi:hypothetical protein